MTSMAQESVVPTKWAALYESLDKEFCNGVEIMLSHISKVRTIKTKDILRNDLGACLKKFSIRNLLFS